MPDFTGYPVLRRYVSRRHRRTRRLVRELALLIIGALIFVGIGIAALAMEVAPVAG